MLVGQWIVSYGTHLHSPYTSFLLVHRRTPPAPTCILGSGLKLSSNGHGRLGMARRPEGAKTTAKTGERKHLSDGRQGPSAFFTAHNSTSWHLNVFIGCHLCILIVCNLFCVFLIATLLNFIRLIWVGPNNAIWVTWRKHAVLGATGRKASKYPVYLLLTYLLMYSTFIYGTWTRRLAERWKESADN